MAQKIDAFYGPFGTGKTEAIIARMKKAWEQGKKSRAIVGDASMGPYIESGLVGAGVLEVVDYSVRDYPSSTLTQLLSGYWPADVNDPTSPLLEPTHKDNAAKLTNLGVFGSEGIAVMGNYLMGNRKGGYAYRAARGEKMGQDAPFRITDAELDQLGKPKAGTGPGLQFGGLAQSHYGFAQNTLLDLIVLSRGYPCDHIIWTTHERAAEDKKSGEKLIGMEVAGSAATPTIGKMFNNVWHFQTATKRIKGKRDEHTEKLVDDLDVEYRVWTRDHISADGVTSLKYLAVTRGVSASEFPHYHAADTPGESVDYLYDLIDQQRKAREDALRKGKVA